MSLCQPSTARRPRACQTVHRLEALSDDSLILKIILRRSDFDDIYKHLLRADCLLTEFFSSAMGGDGGWLRFDAGDDPALADILLRMRYHEVRAALTDNVMEEALLMQLFCRLVTDHAQNASASFGSDGAGKILLYIGEHFRTVTLKELTGRFHFTGDYISRIVRRASGRSATELIASLKIEHACRLLASTDLPVQEIWQDSGFGCKEFFHKKCRETTGMTPMAWRKMAKSKTDA